MVGCLRPYGPELAGNMATWAGFNKNYDRAGRYARTFPLQAHAAHARDRLHPRRR